jgi:hypothetical protein
MRIFRLLISAVAIVGLSACSSSSTADETTTTVAVTTTTEATPDCSQDALDAAVGERETYVAGCVAGWAALTPRSWECGEHCFAFIYKWEQAKWNLTMKCSLYSVLSADGYCTGMTGQIPDGNYTDAIAEFPPKAVACELWKDSFVDPKESKAFCA